jgi:hypothetical protein
MMVDTEITGNDASKKHWGRWYLSKSKPLSLNIYPHDNMNPYEIGLVRINSPTKVLAWINHFIESKNWINLEDIRDFMKACQELQSNGKTPPGEDKQDSHWGY